MQYSTENIQDKDHLVHAVWFVSHTFIYKICLFYLKLNLKCLSKRFLVSGSVFSFTNHSGTNINDALLRALEQMKQVRLVDTTAHVRASIVVFLTDGKATSGITHSDYILMNIRQSNQGRVSIFTLGLGHRTDFSFLQKVALQNNGRAKRIYEEGDVVVQLEHFYEEISTPLLANVRLGYPHGTVLDTSMTQSRFPIYFNGSELLVVGEILGSSSGLTSNIHADAVRRHMSFDTKVNLRHHGKNKMDTEFLERLWAHMTIKKLLNTIMQSSNATVKGVCKTRALGLALMVRYSVFLMIF